MKSISTLLLLLATLNLLSAQSSFLEVKSILDAKCATAGCHNAVAAEGGLDLESGTNSDIYNRLVWTTPQNSISAAAGEKIIYPGRVDKSQLFLKVNKGLDNYYSLDPDAGLDMPPYGSPQLNDTEKEIIRQWILYGAKETGVHFDPQLISDYYNGNGVPSFPNGAPAAPNPADGFQIKMGPFFLPPSGEVELFQKWQLDMPSNKEVNRIETKISNFSHHFLTYAFENSGGNNVDEGLRYNADHSDVSLVYAIQEATDLRLPEGTAFTWESNDVLDLNSHYINYGMGVYAAEAYIDIYTQVPGTALHEMYTFLEAYSSIYIPNNGNTVSFSDELVYPPLGEIFLWGVMGHTHKYGTGYKIWERTANGSQGDLIYDAACAQGEPNCVSPFFDYQHIPMRYFDNLQPVNMAQGLIHEASYNNDGPAPVWWGDTSDDEMMVMIGMYVLDTTGLNLNGNPTSINELNPLEDIRLYPNPSNETAFLELPSTVTNATFRLYDIMGKEVLQLFNLSEGINEVNVQSIEKGLYVYQIEDAEGNLNSGKLVVQ